MATRSHSKGSPSGKADLKDSKDEGKDSLVDNSHEYERAIDAAQSILKKNNPTPNVVSREENESMPDIDVRDGEAAILETSGEGADMDQFDLEIVKADSHNVSPMVVRPLSGNKFKRGSSGLMSTQTIGALPEVKGGRSSSLLSQQQQQRGGAIESSSSLGKSITSNASKQAQSKSDGGGVESKSGDRGTKAVADPVPAPQGGRKLRPQSAQRRRPSLTPNLDIIPEARNVAAIAGEPVNPDHYQTLNIGDVKNVSATCHDARWPLSLVVEQLLEASIGLSNLNTDSSMLGGMGVNSDLFVDTSSETKMGSSGNLTVGDEGLTGAEAMRHAKGQGRRPSFSSNGLLGEAGGDEEGEDELDIDRIGYLKTPASYGGQAKAASIGSSPGGLKGSLSMGNLSDHHSHTTTRHAHDSSPGSGSGTSSNSSGATQTSLKVGGLGQTSTSISVKDSPGGGSMSIPRSFPGLGGLSNREDSRPSSSSRHRHRMFWSSTGLASHTLFLSFFTGWNLHKVFLIAAGVEESVLYPRESELPPTLAREQHRKQGRGIIGANLGPVRAIGGTIGASSGGAFPSLDEDREYAPAKGEETNTGFESRSPVVQARYNIEEDYCNDQDSTSESESEDAGNSRFSAGRTTKGARRAARRSQLQFEQFEFTFGNLIEASKSVKCINLTLTCKPSADFIIVKALSIGASPGEL